MPKLRPAQPLLSIFTKAAASVASMVATPLRDVHFLMSSCFLALLKIGCNPVTFRGVLTAV